MSIEYTFFYGIRGNYVDVTSKMYNRLNEKNYITIPTTDVERVTTFGDHIYGVKKHILIVHDKHSFIVENDRQITINLNPFNPKSTKLYHYYHLWVAGHTDLWKHIFNEHLDNLILSKLLFHLESFYIGFVGPKDKIALAKEILKTRGINYISAIETDSGYEQVTQNKLYEFSLNNDGYVLYSHNKGSFHPSHYSISWRNAMEYHNILNWKFALEKLQNVDAVGIHWLTPDVSPDFPLPFFGGTYWWSHLSYIRKLGYPKNNTRYDAENWIGVLPNIRIIDMKPGFPHY